VLNYLTDDQRLRRSIHIAMRDWNKTHRRHTMFTLADYVGPWGESPDWNEERRDNAIILIAACTKLQTIMEADGVHFPLHEHTGTGLHPRNRDSTISGETYGGFRPQSCPIGATHSSHKEGKAADRYDPDGAIDTWIMAHQDALVTCGIYIEHPDKTPGWSHWGIKLNPDDAPKSGRHVFYP